MSDGTHFGSRRLFLSMLAAVGLLAAPGAPRSHAAEFDMIHFLVPAEAGGVGEASTELESADSASYRNVPGSDDDG